MYAESRLPHGTALWRSVRSTGGATVAADGCVDLIVREDRAYVAGPSTRAIVTASDGSGGSLGLRLPPGRAGELFGAQLSELADEFLPLDQLAGGEHTAQLSATLRRLATQRNTPSVSATESASRVADHVADQVAKFATELAASSAWAEAVRRSAVAAEPARSAAARLAGSERSFRRRMLSTFGYGYATLVRLERARHARTLLLRGSSVGDAAATAGFADQPHLSREFQRLVGMSPGQFAASSA